MQYAQVINGKVEQIASLKSLFPNNEVVNMTSQWFAQNGVLSVIDNIPYDQTKEKLVSIEPKIVNGQVLVVAIEPLTEEDLANKLIEQGERVRIRRNQLLSNCDYTQLPDNNDPKKSEWAIYRQALRDLPTQVGFPNVEFPKDPNYVQSKPLEGK